MIDSKHERILFPDEVLFEEGDRGDCAYVVESGRLRVVTGKAPVCRILADVGPGGLVGEMALIDDHARTASVIALEPSRLRIITRDYLDERLHSSDPMLRHIVRLVVHRFREVIQPVEAAKAHTQHGPERPPAVADHAAAITHLQIRQELESAIEHGEFTLQYQPIFRLRSRSMSGFEALIRWKHPRLGIVPPSEFIPEAERSGLIIPLGHWIFRSALSGLRQLSAAHKIADPQAEPLFMTVNLSGHQFSDANLLAEIEG